MTARKPQRIVTGRAPIPLSLELDRRAREVLIMARTEVNLTQQELASRIGRAQSFVSRIEQGTLPINRVHFATIARALGEDPRTLFAKALAGAIEHAARARNRARTRR